MATRARFGRLPRSAPSLTSTIVALAEAYQAQRDRNIEDAWKQGGDFEGKAVTDKMFLDHWKGRVKDLDPQDPMWDYYTNLISQYEFTIEEQKMGQKYEEKSVSEGEMASFYRKWAAKVPVNSAVYRDLMTKAARFKSAAAARGRGRAASGARDAYYKKQERTYNNQERPFDTATSLIAGYAVQRGILDSKDLDDPDYGWSKLTNAKGENDPAAFSALLTDLQNDPVASKYITEAIKDNGDPNFSGVFNVQTLTTLGNNARNGATEREVRGQKAGLKTDTKAARDAADRYSTAVTLAGLSLGKNGEQSFVEQNEYYRGRMDAMLEDGSGASPAQQRDAIERYQKWLLGTGVNTLTKTLPAGSLDPASVNFNPMAAGVMGRVVGTLANLGIKYDPITRTAQPATPSSLGKNLKDDLYGFSGEEAGASSDSFTLANKVADNQFLMDNIASGAAIVVRTNGNGVPTPDGAEWEVFDRNAPEVKGNDNLIPMFAPTDGSYTSSDGKYTSGGAGGEVRYQVAVPIKVRVHQYQDTATGAYSGELNPYPGMDDTVGKQVNIVGPGGLEVPVYGVYQNGRLVWTVDDPFTDNPTMRISRDSDGSIVRNYTAAVVPTEAFPKTGKGAPPKMGFTPQDFINQNTLSTTDANGRGRQTAFDSPLSAYANASSEHMQWIAGQGDEAVSNAEREWYSQPGHWTPDMTKRYNEAIATGADPEVAYEGVLQNKSAELTNTVQYNRAYGYTPEQRTKSFAGLKMKAEAEAAARQGITIPELRARDVAGRTEAERSALIEQLDEWGGVRTYQAQRPAGMMGPAQTFTATTQSKLPKGWSAADLLSQPGMNLQQANDLVYRITKGAKGTPFSYAPTTGVTPSAGNLAPGGRPFSRPGQNPFMPREGATPAYRPPGTARAPLAPMPQYGPPAPRPAPKPTPNVNAATGFVVPRPATGPAAGPNVSRYTGFTVPRTPTGPAAGPNAAKYPTNGGRNDGGR